MNRLLAIAFVLLTALPACQKVNKTNISPTAVDAMIIHRTGGMVPYGYGHRTFMLMQDRVMEDTSYRLNDTAGYNFNVQLPADKFSQVKALLNQVPSFMLKEPKAVYGDLQFYADGTATYVFVFKNGIKHTFLISDAIETVPPTVRAFAEQVHKAYTDLH